MKILVSAKRVLDYNVRPQVKPDGSGVNLDNVKMSINPFDEIAVEEAVRLKEAGKASEVVIVSIGDTKSEDVLRRGLAIGADKSILIEANEEIKPLQAAQILQKITERENPDMIIMGKQAIDDDCNQTGQMLAQILGWGQATFASKIEITGDGADVTREVDGGLTTVSVKLPAVVTTDLRLNEPRNVPLPNIMKAKSKPLEKVSADSLGVDLSSNIKTLKVEEPAKRAGGVKVASVDELLEKLKGEAKVI